MLISGENEEDPIPLSAYKPDGATESLRASEIEFVESAQALSKGAQKAETREDWQRLLQTVLTGRLDNAQNSWYFNQIESLGHR
jgi:hypothetical protein